jgi:hypothetical protein
MRWDPLQPEVKLNAFLNLADIHLLPQKEDAANLVMPSKLTGMLASGRPVIATARLGTQVARVVEQTGLVVEPGCLPCIVSAIRRLGDSATRRLGDSATTSLGESASAPPRASTPSMSWSGSVCCADSKTSYTMLGYQSRHVGVSLRAPTNRCNPFGALIP